MAVHHPKVSMQMYWIEFLSILTGKPLLLSDQYFWSNELEGVISYFLSYKITKTAVTFRKVVEAITALKYNLQFVFKLENTVHCIIFYCYESDMINGFWCFMKRVIELKSKIFLCSAKTN